MQSTRAIILFVRNERLEGAAKPLPASYRSAGYERLNRRMAERIGFLRNNGIDLILVAEGNHARILCSHVLRQRGETFGERLGNAIADTFALGYRDVVAIGNDCPSLAPSDIIGAFARLGNGAAIVAAPTSDGGAYLIGVHRESFDAERFALLPWRTESLFHAIAALPGASLLPILRDDFDDWNGIEALRALAILLPLHARPVVQQIPARTVRCSTRMKDLTRIFLPAPPAG